MLPISDLVIPSQCFSSICLLSYRALSTEAEGNKTY